jgi:hypothetical protein
MVPPLPYGRARNIFNLQKVNKLDFNYLAEIFIEYWNIKSSEYNEYLLIGIVCTYFIKLVLAG